MTAEPRKNGAVVTKGQHGGARPGAGRPPKRLAYRALVRKTDDIAAESLPSIMRKVIHAAMNGDIQACRLVLERILGKPAPASIPPAEDGSMPNRSEGAMSVMMNAALSDLSDQALAAVKQLLLADLRARGKIDPEDENADVIMPG